MFVFLSRILSFLFLLVIPFGLVPNELKITNSEEVVGAVVIRESTIDIQVRANEHLFVFSKSAGILEKVKIGMEVIYFSQEKLSNEGSAAWKRLKNGDVQILTSNQSKHQVWTIHDNGRLKMESLLHENKDEASLSFEFLNSQVNQLSWLGGKNIEKSIKYPLNESFSPIETNNIQFVMVEFTNVTLKVTPEFKPVGFRFLGGTDGALTFERNTIKTSTSQSESPDGISGKDQGDGVDEKALVLWFDFK